jgi:hypothetical protein
VPVTTAPTPTSTPPSTAPAAIPETEAAIYVFFEGYPVEPGPYLVALSRPGVDDVEGALSALLDGVDQHETSLGLSSTIPEGTALLGVEVVDGVANVDLSGAFTTGGGSLSMMGRVAQVVYTATSFQDVDAVRFLIDGALLDVLGGEGLIIDEPQTREAWEELVSPILIEQPLWGSTFGSELTFSGTANVDSGMVSYVIVDSNGVIAEEGAVSTTPGQRGGFAGSVTIDQIANPGLGSIIVWEWAPDGSQRHVLEYPLTLVSSG